MRRFTRDRRSGHLVTAAVSADGDVATASHTTKMLLVSSSGGVLLELLALAPWWSRHEVAWAAVPAADTRPLLAGQRVHWIGDVSARRPAGLVPGMARARRILHAERPDLVVSAGSGPAVPFFLAAALADIPTLWVCTLNVLGSPGVTARICARLASLVLLQRPAQRAAHPHGIVIGELY